MNRDAAHPFRRGSLLAFAAAALFGVTTPLIERVGRGAGAVPTAAWLYAGATLACLRFRRGAPSHEAPVRLAHGPRLLAVGLIGALAAPASLAWGLQRMGAAGASLLLNLEAVFTAIFGWLSFREPIGRRAGAALALVLGAGILLVHGARSSGLGWGAAAVLVATFGWSLDNALTRPLADLDPTEVVRWKALIGSSLAFALGLALGQPFPDGRGATLLLLIGATGYGLSLRLYLRAQRAMGAGRTASVFAVAPFIGAGVAIALGASASLAALLAPACLAAIGVYLHVSEKHGHAHVHDAVEHEHAHRHDDGHHHHHHPPFADEHSHPHRHERAVHDHPHAPDLHHRHRH